MVCAQRRNVHQLSLLEFIRTKAHLALYERKQRMIFPYPAINPRMPLRASLSRYNVPRTHDFPVPSLQPQILCVGIPPVTRRTTLLLRRKSRKNRAHARVPTLQPLTRRARSRTETHERAHRRCDRAPRAARRCAREHGNPTNHATTNADPCQSRARSCARTHHSLSSSCAPVLRRRLARMRASTTRTRRLGGRSFGHSAYQPPRPSPHTRSIAP